MSQESLSRCLLMWTTDCMAIPRKELKPRTVCCNNSWLVKKNSVSSGFAEKNSDKTKTLVIMSEPKVTLSEVNQSRIAKHGLTRKATADEIHQLRFVTQSLAWIVRQTRLDLSYRISKIQSTFENACVHLHECNRIVKYATSTSTRGIYVSSESSWDDAVVVTISDASFCQEQEQIDGVAQNFNHNRACITALALRNALNAEKMLIHL